MTSTDKGYRRRLTLLAAASLLVPAITIAAEQAAKPFNIPAQSLPGALTRFSAVTGLQVLYEGDIAEQIKAPELNGSYTDEQALGKLLQGSGLNYRYSNGKTITLEKVADAEPKSGDTILKTMTVTGNAS
ncbi:MAG: STN domain-containing protein, partial [Methylococcales bacterium]|nr:STN domain-containing protein [Methylococcales bacterium]